MAHLPTSPIALEPLPKQPHLTWSVPGSKSITNRALVLAALAEGESTLRGALDSDDTRHMIGGLRALGISIEEREPETLVVRGGLKRLQPPSEPIFVGNSGTTVRFLTAVAALVRGDVRLEGDEQMSVRPIADLVVALRQLGVDVDCETGCPPLTVHGGHLVGGLASMRGDRTSQYFSALMLAGGAARIDIEVAVEGDLVSRPYIDVTRRMIEQFGGAVEDTARGFKIIGRAAGYQPQDYTIEPDASTASYAFALAAATGGSITVPKLTPQALQGDYGFVNVLEKAGATISSEQQTTTVQGTGSLRGIDVVMRDISDTVMTLAAIAPLAEGRTTIRDIANIRIKETDRIAALVNELERLGQQVRHGEDWISIDPRPIRPARIECYSDHRIAMSFAILGAVRPGITIENPACVAKTYPCFWDDLARVYRDCGATPGWARS